MTKTTFIDGVTVIKAEFLNALQEELGKTIASATINDAGHLLLTLSDGSTVDAGDAVGPPGERGETPQLSIGTVTTVDEDEDADASIGGTAAAPVLNLSLPRGPQGEPGSTPEKGVDYFTAGDKVELVTQVKKQAPWPTPQLYGALANGANDDSAAFQAALANNRVVYAPGGTYLLSGGLTIRPGCQLILAPDAVLSFTQPDGNCITLEMSASLWGNHAVVNVPYAFSGNVVYVSTTTAESLTDVPPFAKWDPQWKTARYVADLSICKPDSRGFHYSEDGSCAGTAVYIEADGSATSTFIWGLNFSGLRIAGAFGYGVRAKMLSEGWAHEMRIEAFIDACEIGVSIEDCNNCYISAIVQPRAALSLSGDSIPYARHGIQLIRSRNTDLSGSRVWDWNPKQTLWTSDAGCEYQHIAMRGNCAGTILNDFFYWEMPSYDIRSLIYSDTAENLEKINILQEPFTRWFKPSADGLTPLFFNGSVDKELLQKDAFDALFQTSLVANFTNRLAQATAMDGSVFNEIGYQKEATLASSDGNTVSSASGLSCTGFMPCAEGTVVRMKGISFLQGDGSCRVYLYDADKTKLVHVGYTNLIANGSSSIIDSYTATEDGCSFRVAYSTAKYMRMVVYSSTISSEPIITTDEEIAYSQEGFLADSVKVKAASVDGLAAYEKLARKATALSSDSTDEQYPSAKAVVDYVNARLAELSS